MIWDQDEKQSRILPRRTDLEVRDLLDEIAVLQQRIDLLVLEREELKARLEGHGTVQPTGDGA